MPDKLERVPIDHWNYRVVVTAEDENEHDLEICEVYYDKDDKPLMYAKQAPGGSDLKEIHAVLRQMRKALERPILGLQDGKLVEVQ